MKSTTIGVFAVAVLFIISSCKENIIYQPRENDPPVITLTAPADSAGFALGDTVHVIGYATDDHGLHEMRVFVTYQFDTIYSNYPDVHEIDSFPFHYMFKPSFAGNYYLYVMANDHDSTATTLQRYLEVTP